MRQIVLLLHPGVHEPRGRPHGAAPAAYTAPPCAAWPGHAPHWRWLAGALSTHSEGEDADASGAPLLLTLDLSRNEPPAELGAQG